MRLLENALSQAGEKVVRHPAWLDHPASGYSFSPRMVEMEPRDDGNVRIATTIQANHPTLSVEGVFEFQHTVGASIHAAALSGFQQWAETDFVALCDLLEDDPRSCTTMAFAYPASNGGGDLRRRIVFGPVFRAAQYNPEIAEPGHEPFCPCCLLMNCIDAFEPMLKDDAPYFVRLFASRDDEGATQADCRVNGEGFAPGIETLNAYAQTWPQAGFEYRKQYVILHTAK